MTKTTIQVKEQLAKIGRVYPTIMGLMQKATDDTGTKTIGTLWAEMLAESINARPTMENLKFDHLANVCDEIAALQRQPIADGQTSDQLPFNIRAEMDYRAWRDFDRWQQHVKYEAQKKPPADFMGSDRIGVLAVWLGRQVLPDWKKPEPNRDYITKAENAERIEQLIKWDAGDGPRPDWLP